LLRDNRLFLRIGQTPAATIKPPPFPCALQSELQTGDRATKASEVVQRSREHQRSLN
jgi:hypothetical protein